jgi:hypothetical protein
MTIENRVFFAPFFSFERKSLVAWISPRFLPLKFFLSGGDYELISASHVRQQRLRIFTLVCLKIVPFFDGGGKEMRGGDEREKREKKGESLEKTVKLKS